VEFIEGHCGFYPITFIKDGEFIQPVGVLEFEVAAPVLCL
jgi:hypothetical protein